MSNARSVTGPQPAITTRRSWQIDRLRGLAVITIVIYHFLFLLDFLQLADVEVYTGFWRLFARTGSSLFLGLVGMSLVISAERAKAQGAAERDLTRKFLKRGSRIFAWGLVLTLVTWLVLPQAPIVFGILHLIGVSLILGRFLLPLPWRWLYLVGAASVLLLWLWLPWPVSSSLLIPFGFPPHNFQSLDYFPLPLWFGLVMMGMAFGKLWLASAHRHKQVPPSDPLSNTLIWLGQHSLPMYLLHVPAILVLFWLFVTIRTA